VSIIPEDLDRRKLSAKWVPNRLNADQKRQRYQSSEKSFEFFRGDLNVFLSRLVTINETWLYHNDPEKMQQSLEWQHSGSPRHKYSERKNRLENFSPRLFSIKTVPSSLIIFKRANLTLVSITYLCWCI